MEGGRLLDDENWDKLSKQATKEGATVNKAGSLDTLSERSLRWKG